MVGLSFDGLITGLNTQEIIDALVSIKRAPAQRLAARRDVEANRLSAIQGLNASVLGIQVAANGLRTADAFRAREATSSNPSIASVVATSNAELGSFTLSVQQTAQAQQISSDPNNVFTDATSALGIEGTIQVNGRNVEVRDSDNLRDIANRISNSGALVAASVIEVETGQFRLSVRSVQTGAEAFSLTDVSGNNVLEQLRLAQDPSFDTIRNPIADGAASENFNVRVLPVGGLLSLSSNIPAGTVSIGNSGGSFDVALDLSTQSLDDIVTAVNNAAGAAGSAVSASVVEVEQGVFRLEILSGDGTEPTFADSNNVLETLGVLQPTFVQVDQEGRDAQFTLNGIQVVRSTNNISDVIGGVSFSLLSDADPAAVTTLSVTAAQGQAGDRIQNFVNAFNETRNFLRQFASYNPETQRAGVLLGDSSVLSVESSLTSLFTRRISTLPSQNLASLNGGLGVASGSIRITDRLGQSAEIDLSPAQTVQDAINRINAADIGVEARINRNGTGFTLVDTTGGGGPLSVEEVNGGTTAADLGILGSRQSSTLEGSAVAQADFRSFSELGVSFNADGTINFNRLQFDAALDANFASVEAFFRQTGGFADLARDATGRLTDARTGVLAVRAEGIQSGIENFNDSIRSIEARVETEAARLRRQFTALEQSVSQLQNQGEFLLSQLSQLNNFNRNR